MKHKVKSNLDGLKLVGLQHIVLKIGLLVTQKLKPKRKSPIYILSFNKIRLC